ncbi:MAG: flagellar M-ring protein FliF [Gaiellaceae bacterium]|nr:flagellar M-ring protein FliF [Gaiellaceae bacterium]
MQNIRNLIANMTPRGRLMMGGSIAAVVLLVFFMMRIAGSPSYSTVMAGIDPAQTGKITAALDAKGIKYEIQNNGTALAVEKSQLADARIALASKGLPNSAQPGFELFDKQKLGASDFQQQVTYQRALEGQLAGTISQIDGVGGATVQLVLPQDQLFDDEQSAAKAAVLLSGGSNAIQPGAVRGIAQMVSGSVKGLALNNVSITDSTGQLLWPNAAGGATDGQMVATSKQAAEARYSQGVESNLNAMLTQTLGPGKAQVQVNADLNADRTTEEELTYGKKGVPLATEKDNETLRGGGAAGGGAAGTASNTVPSYAGAGGGGNSNYKHQKGQTQFGVDKKVTKRQIAPGAVNKLNVAVIVDKSVPKAEVAAVRSAVQNAAGITPQRGDKLSVSQVAFAKPPAAPKKAAAASIIGYAKYAGAALALLLFLFFVTRHLRRREDQALGQPVWLREIESPTSLAELERGMTGDEPTMALSRARPLENPLRGELEELVDREPERVAHQVRAWMNEE